MRAIWKGHVRFSLVTIPVQLYSAVENKSAISFKQLHNKDNGSIGYKKVCKSCEETVPYGDIVKGYEYEPDNYVVLEKSDFENIKLKSNRVVEIDAFVSLDEVHPTRYEAIYFMGPDGEVAQGTYNLFAKTLKKSNKAGVGRIILRDREDVVLLTEHKGGLIMYKLRYPYELRKIEDVPDLKEDKIDESQLKLAETLVESLTKPFSEIDFEDRFRDALLELVQTKIDGKEVVAVTEVVKETPVVDIMDALKKSINEAKRKGA